MKELNALSFDQLVKTFGISSDDQSALDFTLAKSAEGRQFPVFGVKDGGTYIDKDGDSHPSMTFFAFGKKSAVPGVDTAEDLQDWLVANLNDVRFLCPEDIDTADGHTAKFGVMFLQSSRRLSANALLAKVASLVKG